MRATVIRNNIRIRKSVRTHCTVPLCCALLLISLLTIAVPAWASPVERVSSGDKLIAIIPAYGPPSFYRDKRTGEAAGFFVDMTKAVAKRAGFSVTFIFGDNWDAIRDSIQRGEADIGPGLAVSPEREQYYVFTQPFDVFPLSVFARAGSGLAELKQGSVVGVLRGSVAYEQLRIRPGIQVLDYNNFETGLFELLSGKIDAFAGPSQVLWSLAREAGVEDHIKVVGKPLAEVKRALGIKKGREELAARLNKALDGLIGSAEYTSIFAKWYGKPQPHFALSQKTLWTVIAVIFLVIGLATWRHLSIMALTRRLGKEVEERKRIEETTNLSEERMYLAMRASNLGLYDLNIKTGEAVVNAAYALMLGYDPGEFHENNAAWLERLHPDDKEPVAETFQSYIKGLLPEYIVEFRQRTKDGVWIWIRSHGKIVEWDADRNPVRMLGTHSDISKAKAAEEALRESEALYRELFEAESDAIVLVDNETGRIIEANSAAANLYGFNRADLLSKKNTDLSAEPEDTQRVTQRVTLTPGEIVKIPQRLHRNKDGVVFPVEITGRFFTLFGRAVHIAAIRDISERRKVEKEQEQFLRFFQTSTDIMVIADPNGAFLKTNPACTDLLGYSSEELVAKPFVDFIHPDDKQPTLDEMARQQQTGFSLNFENRYRCKDGSFKWMSWRATFVKEEGITYATARDITMTKQIQENLVKRERQLSESQEVAKIGSWSWDIVHNTLDWSDEAYRRFDTDPQTLTPTAEYFVSLIHPEDKPGIQRAMQDTLERDMPYHIQPRIKNESGREWVLEGFGMVERDSAGKPLRFAGTVQDITDRKAAEDRLLNIMTEQQIILDNASVGIWKMIDRKAVWVNLKTLDLLQYPTEELIGQSTRKLYPSQEAYEQLGRKAYPVLAQGSTYQTEQKLLRRDGTEIWVRYNGKAIEPPDLSKGVIWILEDVTNRKLDEEQLLRTLKEKEVLLKEIHHRVKNNMQVIYSLLNLQAKGIADQKVRAMFEESQSRVRSMALIHERLYNSRDLAHIEFKEYLKSLVSEIAHTYKRPEVILSVDMGPLAMDVNVGIPCGLIVNELVSNCLKHAFFETGKGTILIGINNSNDGSYVLTVSDDGVGFPADIDFRNTVSLGLQLVIVLTGQLHGTIELLKEEGTTFRITFPENSITKVK